MESTDGDDSNSGGDIKIPKVPQKYKEKVTLDEVPEGWKCEGPKTDLSSFVCHAAKEKDYVFLREYIAMAKCIENLDLNEQDEMGMTALHFAVCLKDVPCVQILVDAGASCNLRDQHGFTPLFYATGRYTCVDIAGYLLEKGKASVHAVTKTGASPLHGAALMGSADCVKLLLKHGADPRCEDEESNAPLDLAKGDETKRLLHKYGRKKDEARDKIGECCANCGAESEHLKRCGRCHVMLYCTKECQATHWKEGGHKKSCKGYVIAKATSSHGKFSSTINHKKRQIYTRTPDSEQGGSFLKNKQFIVKVQLPLGGGLMGPGPEEAMVYNEDRTVQGFLSSDATGYVSLKKRIANEGWMGVKSFFWAELCPDKTDGSFKIFHGKCAPFQSW